MTLCPSCRGRGSIRGRAGGRFGGVYQHPNAGAVSKHSIDSPVLVDTGEKAGSGKERGKAKEKRRKKSPLGQEGSVALCLKEESENPREVAARTMPATVSDEKAESKDTQQPPSDTEVYRVGRGSSDRGRRASTATRGRRAGRKDTRPEKPIVNEKEQVATEGHSEELRIESDESKPVPDTGGRGRGFSRGGRGRRGGRSSRGGRGSFSRGPPAVPH